MCVIIKFQFQFQYTISDDTVAPVYYGNTLKPTHAKDAPNVSFDATIKLAGDKVCFFILFVKSNEIIIFIIDHFRVVIIHCGL